MLSATHLGPLLEAERMKPDGTPAPEAFAVS
jgi:hypothetical protein